MKILTGAEVESFTSGSKVRVTLKNQTLLEAKALALCTNAFTNQLLTQKVHLKPGRGLVLALKPSKALRFNGTFHMEEGYYYFRDHEGYLLFGGGRNLDFESETSTVFEVNEKIKRHLVHLLKNYVLPDQDFEIESEWTGIMAFGDTKKPIIKRVDENTYIGVRLGGMGVAIGSLVGEKLASLVSQSV